MSLNFPNLSRSYDAVGHCIRFWGYESAMEVPFFVDAAALSLIDPGASRDEPGLLGVFDAHRDRVIEIARNVYSRGRRGSYVLASTDVRRA